MSDDQKTETVDEKLARLRGKKQGKLDARAEARRLAEVERLELEDRFERELRGAEGTEFMIWPSTPDEAVERGVGHVVVKRPDAISFNKYLDVAGESCTPADRYDFVAPCVVHPALEEYQRIRQALPGLDLELSNRCAKLGGLRIKIDQGK